MEYFTADTYKNWERIGEPFNNDKGNLVTKVKCECPRCSGTGIYAIGVENGQIKPHPAYNGVCLQCDGRGKIIKIVRLYTEKQYNNMKKAKERRIEKQNALPSDEELDLKRQQYFEKNGFSAEGVTYVITGDSYSIKDELKENGFKFDSVLKWHRASAEGYEDRVIEVKWDEIIKFNPFGTAFYVTNAVAIVDEKIAATQPQSTSDWVGKEGEKYTVPSARLTRKNSYQGKYGLSFIYSFEDESGNVLNWFTAKVLDIENGDIVKLVGTVKSHSEYKGVKNTVLTRCKITKAE